MTRPFPSAPRLSTFAIVGGACGLLSLWPSRLEAQDLRRLETHLTGTSEGFSDQVNSDMTTTTASSLSDSGGGPRWNASTSASYGSGTVHAFAGVPMTDNIDFGYYGQGNVIAEWVDTFAISSPSKAAGKLRFTMAYSGDTSVTTDIDKQATCGVTCSRGDGLVYAQYATSNGGGGIIPPTFVFDVSSEGNVLAGRQFTVNFAIQSTAYARSIYGGGVFEPGGSAIGFGSLRCVGITALDDADQPIDYTAESNMGSARALTYPAGGTFGSFSLTNAAPSSRGTTMQLLDGAASAVTTVNAAFIAPPSDNAIKPFSDVVDLQGTNADPVVIQVNYDAAGAQSIFGSAIWVELAWFQNSTGTWKNAVLGNIGTTMPTFFNRAYNPATDFHLGYCGNDTANHRVWAVVNHNSQFVATVSVPALAVSSVSRSAQGIVHLNCKGEPARANRIESSADLLTWTTLASVTADGSGAFQFDDTATTGRKKFYRVSYP